MQRPRVAAIHRAGFGGSWPVWRAVSEVAQEGGGDSKVVSCSLVSVVADLSFGCSGTEPAEDVPGRVVSEDLAVVRVGAAGEPVGELLFQQE
jgi:hypothetical protein